MNVIIHTNLVCILFDPAIPTYRVYRFYDYNTTIFYDNNIIIIRLGYYTTTNNIIAIGDQIVYNGI